MNKTRVAVVKGPAKPNEQQIDSSVQKAIELVDGLAGIKKDDIVIIKPNICAPSETGSARCTNPAVVKAIADMIKGRGAQAIIAESAGVLDEDTESSIRACGYDKLRDKGFEVIDLKAKGTALKTVPIPNGKVLKKVTLPKILLDAKLIISVPVMKTHAGQKITVALKNMKGILPDTWKKKLHMVYGVAPGLADVFRVVKPGLAVVDGIVAQEGLGPMFGTPVDMGLIIACKDAVAVDTVAAEIMGFDPMEVPLLEECGQAKLGIADLKKIEVVGTPIKEVKRRFKRVEEAAKEAVPASANLNIVIQEKACTGCRESIWFLVHDLNQQKNLDVLKGWTIVAGQTHNIPKARKDELLLVGLCTSKYKKLGTFIEGCPPQPWEVLGVLTGKKTMAWHD